MSHRQDHHLFWNKVDKRGPDECWPWTGYRKPSGHGLTTLQKIPIHASRKAWILLKGPIRDGNSVLHKCDNAACCNPAHLYLGTRADNMIDRWSKRPAGERGALGRPHILDDKQLAELWEMRRVGATMQECADKFGVHFRTIARYITTIRKAKLAELRKKIA